MEDIFFEVVVQFLEEMLELHHDLPFFPKKMERLRNF